MKVIKEQALYFHDFMSNEKESKKELDNIIAEFKENGIEFENEIPDTDVPPMRGSGKERNYDILFFDWGGASVGCQGLFDSFCRKILEESLDCPSKVYVMCSLFTARAMKEAKTEFERDNGSVPPNVFLTIKEASEFLTKVW